MFFVWYAVSGKGPLMSYLLSLLFRWSERRALLLPRSFLDGCSGRRRPTTLAPLCSGEPIIPQTWIQTPFSGETTLLWVKYTSGRTIIYSYSTDYLIKNPPHRCKGILAVRGEDVQVMLHHQIDKSNWWYVSLLKSDWQTDKQRYAYCLFAWVIVIMIMIMPAGDDPRGGGHVRHVQDPALGRQTESEHLGRDRAVRVVCVHGKARLSK